MAAAAGGRFGGGGGGGGSLVNSTYGVTKVAATNSGDGSVTIVALAPPTITGGSTTHASPGSTTDTPFAGVAIGDANTGSPTDTLNISLSDQNAALAEGATYSGPLSLVSDGNGEYTLGGTAAADTAANVTTALDALTLTAPTIVSGGSGVEALTLSLSDVSSRNPGQTATGSVTAEIATTARETLAFSGKIETVTIGVSGYYDITAEGAQGGRGSNDFPSSAGLGGGGAGGLGAMASGDVYLQAGAKLEIVVGGAGGA